MIHLTATSRPVLLEKFEIVQGDFLFFLERQLKLNGNLLIIKNNNLGWTDSITE